MESQLAIQNEGSKAIIVPFEENIYFLKFLTYRLSGTTRTKRFPWGKGDDGLPGRPGNAGQDGRPGTAGRPGDDGLPGIPGK